jgi:hypothetical protein
LFFKDVHGATSVVNSKERYLDFFRNISIQQAWLNGWLLDNFVYEYLSVSKNNPESPYSYNGEFTPLSIEAKRWDNDDYVGFSIIFLKHFTIIPYYEEYNENCKIEYNFVKKSNSFVFSIKNYLNQVEEVSWDLIDSISALPTDYDFGLPKTPTWLITLWDKQNTSIKNFMFFWSDFPKFDFRSTNEV